MYRCLRAEPVRAKHPVRMEGSIELLTFILSIVNRGGPPRGLRTEPYARKTKDTRRKNDDELFPSTSQPDDISYVTSQVFDIFVENPVQAR